MKTLTKPQFESSPERALIEKYLKTTYERVPQYDWMQNMDGQFIVGWNRTTLRFTMEGGEIKKVEEIGYK